jgi:hypothetical protein
MGFGADPQHSGDSSVASQELDAIHWRTPVDLNPTLNGNDILIHYGSPVVTANNTVIYPVKTGSAGGFRVEARNGATGALKWAIASDFILPAHNWVPSFGITLTPGGQLFFPGAGGTIYVVNNPDANGATVSRQIAFYGIGNYSHRLFDGTVAIDTPLTSDSQGNLYFGFVTSAGAPLGLHGGLARMGADGVGTWISAGSAALDGTMNQVVYNCAPALSNDGSLVYVAVSNANEGDSGNGYLVALNSVTLHNVYRALLHDPQTGQLATLPNDGSATPMVGPDGDVYFGVLENPFSSSRGWLLHFSSNLQSAGVPGAFGWDDTASIVPVSMVPSYQGFSPYLIMTKYNDYGDGNNRLAILDPNASELDQRTGETVMQEVLTIKGITPDPNLTPNFPGAVREWCINDTAVDPGTNSILANSEDGRLYRWDLTTNQLTQVAVLTRGIGEAYTPTVIGTDGTVYAINDGILFAVGANPQAAANRNFVTHVYEDTLFREPDLQGLFSWSQALDQGTSRTAVINGILGSLEYRTKEVQAMYRYFLHREADPNGITTFVRLLAAGATVEQVEDDLVGSGEYFATRAGNNFSTFLNAMYQDALHRNIDSAGFSFFSGNQNRMTHVQMADIVFRSHERHLLLVNYPAASTSVEIQDGLIVGYYQRFLHRDADSNGWSLFAALLDSGTRDEVVIFDFLDSPEYYLRQ